MPKVNVNPAQKTLIIRIDPDDMESAVSMLDDLNDGSEENNQMTEWESNFVTSLSAQLERNPSVIFSEKQYGVLKRIHSKITSYGDEEEPYGKW